MDKKYQNQQYLIKAVFWAIALFLGILQAWSSRYSPSGDITAYLDMSDAYLRRNWEQAINAYFSPLYSWLLMLFFSIVKPSSYWEFFAVKLVNLLTYIFSILCFNFLLSEFIVFYKNKTNKKTDNYYIIPEWVWLVAGYILFLWSAIKLIGVDMDTPDMLVAGIIYLATALALRVYRQSENWFNFIALGAVLGVGYLTKTFMFPMAFIFLVVCFFSVRNIQQAFPKVILSFLVFCFLSSPFIYVLSRSKGHLTFGDTGRLNYTWYINGVPAAYWQGEPPGSGIPKHPVQKIFEQPEIYYFGMHFDRTTFPAWYDSSYWYEGVKTHFNLIKQVEILAKNIIFYYQQFLGILFFGYLTLVSLSGRFMLSLKNSRENWRLLVPAGLGLGLYMMATDMLAAQPSMRYIAPCIVLLFAGVFSSVHLPNSQESKRLIAGITLGTLVLFGTQFTDLWQPPGEPIYWKVAQGLNQLGVYSGDKVAVIQLRGQNGTKDYWARLARLTIVAEIPSRQSFWASETTTRAEVYKVVESTGAKVIVQKQGANTPDFMSAHGWQEIGDTDYYAYLLDE